MLVEENVSKLIPLKYPKVTQKYLDLVIGDIADVQLHFHVHQSILSPAVYWCVIMLIHGNPFSVQCLKH